MRADHGEPDKRPDKRTHEHADHVAYAGAHAVADPCAQRVTHASAHAEMPRPCQLLRARDKLVQAVCERLRHGPVPLRLRPQLAGHVHALQHAHGPRAPHDQRQAWPGSELQRGVRFGLPRPRRRVPADHGEPDARADDVTDDVAYAGAHACADARAHAVADPCAHARAHAGAHAEVLGTHQLLRARDKLVQAVCEGLRRGPVSLWLRAKHTRRVHAVQHAHRPRAPHDKRQAWSGGELRGGVRRGLSRSRRRVPADHQQPHAEPNFEPYARSNARPDGFAHAEPNFEPDARSYARPDGFTHSGAHTVAHAQPDRIANGVANTDANARAHSSAHAGSNSLAHAEPDSIANSVAHTGPDAAALARWRILPACGRPAHWRHRVPD